MRRASPPYIAVLLLLVIAMSAYSLTRPTVTKFLGFVRAFSSSASHIVVSLSQQRQQQYQQQRQQQHSNSRKRAPVSSSQRTAAFSTSSFSSFPTKEIFEITPFEPTPATAKDLACIEDRQLLHPITCAGGPRQLCSHGFPQAFVFHPSKTTLNSGMFRLCCPLLVKAVDEYEAKGALREWNKKLENSPEMQREFRRVNARHSAIRRSFVEPEHLAPYLEKMGKEGVEQILASGIAGVSPEKTEDLKCLHAHLADYLCTHDNFIGKEIYEYLERTRNVPVTGSSTCWQQCDSSFERTEDSWWYTPIKNKQKLRSKYHRRTARKQELKGKEGEAEREGVEEKGEKKREERGWEGQEWDERQRRP